MAVRQKLNIYWRAGTHLFHIMNDVFIMDYDERNMSYKEVIDQVDQGCNRSAKTYDCSDHGGRKINSKIMFTRTDRVTEVSTSELCLLMYVP